VLDIVLPHRHDVKNVRQLFASGLTFPGSRMPDDTADDHQSFRQQRALQDLVIGAQLGCFDIVDTDEPWQIVSLSFCVSLTATFLATLAGISCIRSQADARLWS